MSSNQDPATPKPTILSLIFCVLLIGFFLLFLVLISGGFFFYVILVMGCLGLFGWVHYLIWGKILTEQAAGVREESEPFERAKAAEKFGHRIYKR